MVDGEVSFPGSVADVSAREVREALFAQSVKKAPGVDGIGFKALRLLWRWAEDRVVALVQGCIRIGYHPCTWKTAKGILLRKQGKPTYTAAKAYRVISLLSCLGKVVEKAIATWIASYCERQDIFHRGQFGCRRGRGTSDAVAQLVAKSKGRGARNALRWHYYSTSKARSTEWISRNCSRECYRLA